MDGRAKPFVKRGTHHPVGKRKRGLPTGNSCGSGGIRNRLDEVLDGDDVTSKSEEFGVLGAGASNFDEGSRHVGCVLESQCSPVVDVVILVSDSGENGAGWLRCQPLITPWTENSVWDQPDAGQAVFEVVDASHCLVRALPDPVERGGAPLRVGAENGNRVVVVGPEDGDAARIDQVPDGLPQSCLEHV